MKRVLLVLLMAVAFVSCEREVNVDVTVPPCEDGECQGAKIVLAAQARGPVNRGDLYAWIDVITVEAIDDQGADFGDVFNLVDNNSGADGFYLNNVTVNKTYAFGASSTSKAQGAGDFVINTGNPDNLNGFEGRMPYAEYATDTPVSQFITPGDNLVNLQMNTNHGRLISSFELAEDIQYNKPNSNDPMYKLVVTRGVESAYATRQAGVVSYWNDAASLSGETLAFTVEIRNFETNAVVYTRNITETIVASTSTTNKYVVGLDFADSTTVEVVFSWQAWTEGTGIDETDVITSPNGLDCSSCGTVTTQTFNGNVSLTGDTVISDKNLNYNGGLNLNGYTLTVSCGNVHVNGNFNGNGTIIVAGNLTVTGATQNNPTIHANECF